VYHDVNVTPVGGWPNNYRAPDLIILLPDRFAIDHNEYSEGAPSVVVEIHSPGDEAYEKLEFYADLGVPEVWIIDRDGGVPDLYQLKKADTRKNPFQQMAGFAAVKPALSCGEAVETNWPFA
jgi:Uma2 family endonuclease